MIHVLRRRWSAWAQLGNKIIGEALHRNIEMVGMPSGRTRT